MARGKDTWSDSWMHPPPVPEVEEGGDSAWAVWHSESQRLDLGFAQTQPSAPMPLDGAAPLPQQPQAGARWSTDDVMVLARRNNRVCPRPALWSGVYLLIDGDRYADLQPPPVQAWQWRQLSNLQRRLRFREYIAWADRHGRLQPFAQFLARLAESDWVHMGED